MLVPPATPKVVRVRTYSPKASEITRKWFVIDAEDLVLGRLSTEAARILRGKHKPVYAPHLDMGDHVIVVNAEKVVLTANKAEQKMVYRHRSEEHTSELQSLMRISYAVFCLKKK